MWARAPETSARQNGRAADAVSLPAKSMASNASCQWDSGLPSTLRRYSAWKRGTRRSAHVGWATSPRAHASIMASVTYW